MKKLGKILLWGLVVLVAALAVAWLTIDSLAKSAIERGATYATGVRTSLDGISISLLHTKVATKGLVIDNPAGYSSPHLLKMDKMNVAADRGTVFSDKIVVQTFEIDGLDINIEQQLGANNVSVILANLQKLSSPGEKPKKEGGRRLQVDRVTIRNVTAHVQLLPIPGRTSVLDVTVPVIVLDDVTSDKAAGTTVAELTARILPAIMKAVIEKGGGLIPSDLAGTIQKDVDVLAASLGKSIEDMLKNPKGVGETLQGLFKKKPTP